MELQITEPSGRRHLNELEYFLIKGLHGRQDINLVFSGRTTVFIVDNGSGKTTALFFLNAILSGRLSLLGRFEYDSITIKIATHDAVTITPKDFELSRLAGQTRNLVTRTDLPRAAIEQLMTMASHTSFNQLRDNTLLTTASRQMRIPIRLLYDRLVRMDLRGSHQVDLFSLSETPPVLAIKALIADTMPSSVLYLPTYRRVEQELGNLLEVKADEEADGADIHFGMKDVDAKIAAATKQIRDHFVESYGQISGQMLGQLVENTNLSEVMQKRFEDRPRVELVLGRVRSNISESQKSLILSMLDVGSLLKDRHLSFFLARLMEAYDEVEDVDTALQTYARVCNGYLANKALDYDSLSGTLTLRDSLSGRIRACDSCPLAKSRYWGSWRSCIWAIMSRMP